jgi:hypothetical protein
MKRQARTPRNPAAAARRPRKVLAVAPLAIAPLLQDVEDWHDSSLDLLRGLDVIDLDVDEALIASTFNLRPPAVQRRRAR